MAIGAYPFALEEVYVTSRCGTAQALLCANELTLQPEYENKELRCGTKTVASASYIRKLTGSIDFGGVAFEALAIMLGQTVTTYARGGGSARSLLLACDKRPCYFSLYGKAVGDECDDLHVRLFKVKLTSGPELKFSGDNFGGGKLKFDVLCDEQGNFGELVGHEVEQEVLISPYLESANYQFVLDADCAVNTTGCDCGTTITTQRLAAWLDKAGNNNAATQTTSSRQPILQTYNGNTAVCFDGVDDYLEAPFAASSNEWTWLTLITPTNFAGVRTIWEINGNFRLTIEAGTLHLRNGSTEDIVGPFLSLNGPSAIAVTGSGGQYSLYVNGTFVNEESSAPDIGIDSSLSIGSFLGSQYFAGCIYDFQVVNEVLSAAAIRSWAVGALEGM